VETSRQNKEEDTLSKQRKNPHEFGKGSKRKKNKRRRNICLCNLPFMLKTEETNGNLIMDA